MTHIGTVEVDRESAVVIYEPRTGQILHLHYVATMKGGSHPDQKTQERDALEQLSHAQPDAKKATAILHVDAAEIEPGRVYKVDPKRRRLVKSVAPKGRKAGTRRR